MRSKAYRSFEDFCLNAQPSREALPESFRLLRQCVDSDHAAFFSADERGDLSGGYHEIPEHNSQAARFIERAKSGTDGRSAEKLPSVRELFRMAVPVQHLSFGEVRARETSFFREVIGPIGGRNVLRAAARGGASNLGLIALVRGGRTRGFSEREEKDLLALTRPFARWLRRAGEEDEQRFEGEGFLVVSPSCEVLLLSREALTLTVALEDPRFLPVPSRDAILRALLEGYARDGQKKLILELGRGRFEFELIGLDSAAAASAAETRHLVRARHFTSTRLADLARIDELGFSSMQRSIALDLLRGRTQAEMAEDHGIRPSTVITHTRDVYNKAGVTTRRDFIEVIRRARAS